MSNLQLPTDVDLAALARSAGDRLLAARLRLVLAESCTGGWLAKTLTDIAGSSQWFERGYVTYSNASKQDTLGVRAETLAANGAISGAVVAEMASGALQASGADLALAISGIAGPDGGTAAKPVGLVWFGLARRGSDTAVSEESRHFPGDRENVRRAAVAHGLALIVSAATRA